MISKDEGNLEKIKSDIINKLKSLSFSLKVLPISGEESLNVESVQSTCAPDNKSQSFTIPVKLYVKSKKMMVQGTPDCRNHFMRHFKDISVHQEMKVLLNLDKSHQASTNRVVNDVLVQPQLSQHTTSMSIQSSSAPESGNPVIVVDGKSSDSKSKSLANTSDTLLSSRLSSVISFSTPLNTSIASKFLERDGLVLTPSIVAHVTQIKETVTCLESEFASFKFNTDNRLADSISNEMFQDKIIAINRQHKLEIRNLKSRVNDLDLSNGT